MQLRLLILTGILMFIGYRSLSQSPTYARPIGGTGIETVTDIFADTSGNVYITGSFEGTVDFDPSATTVNLVSNGGPDIFFAKYNSSGFLVFAKSIGGSMNDEGRGIRTDASGNILLTGYFMDNVDFDPNAGTQLMNSNLLPDVFIAKYDATGNYIFAKQTQGTGEVFLEMMQTDVAGNFYIAGNFYGPCNMDPGASNYTLASSGGSSPDAFVAKYDNNGNFLFANEMQGPGFDVLRGLAVDGSQNIYVSGYFELTTTFSPGVTLTASSMQDAYFAKFNSNGNFQFVKQLGGFGSEEASAITTDPAGNIFVSGFLDGTADLDPGAAVYNINSQSLGDIYFSKYDNNGNFIFGKQLGEGAPHRMTCDATGNLYLTGHFDALCDFDPSSTDQIDTSYGGTDIFFARYSNNGDYNFNWHFGGNSGDKGVAMHVDLVKGVFLCANFFGSISVNGNGTGTVTGGGSQDFYFAKYSVYGRIKVSQGPFVMPDYFGNYYYGTVPVGGSSGMKTFTIENEGTGNLKLTGAAHVNLYGPDMAEFTLDTSLTQYSINPNESTTFAMSFNPTSAVEKRAIIKIVNNGGFTTNYLFHVNGNTEPEIDLNQGANNYPSGSTANFGSGTVGSVVTTYTFSVSNSGNDTLNLTGTPRAKITGPNASDFTVTLQPGQYMGAGQASPVIISFTPGDTGLRVAQLIIDNNDLDEYHYVVNLNGTGSSPVFGIQLNGFPVSYNDTLVLDTMNAMATKSYIFQIHNYGNSNLLLTGNPIAYIYPASNDFSYNYTSTQTTILPGDSTSITLNVTPDSAGSYFRNLSIQNNSPGGGMNFYLKMFARDTIPPRIIYASSLTADGTYSVGNEILIQVNATEPLIINGTPSLSLNSGGTGYLTGYVWGTSFPRFLYTVNITDASPDLGVYDTLSLHLNNGSITDTSGNQLYPYIPAPSFNGDNVVINTALTTAILTTDATSPDQINTFKVTVNFTHEVNGFDTSDVKISNGTLSNYLILSPGRVFSFDITPIDTGTVVVWILRNAAIDSAGIGNTPSNILTIHALLDRQRIVYKNGWIDKFHHSSYLTSAINPVFLKTVVDSSNNIILAGTMRGTGDFDPDTSVFIPVANNSTGNILISKYTETGLMLFAKILLGSTENTLRDIAVDATGNIYIVGLIYDTLDLDPGPADYNIIAEGYSDGFMAKYDPNGNFLWGYKFGSNGDSSVSVYGSSDMLQSISIDTNGDLLVCGSFRGTVDLDPGPGTQMATSINFGNAFFSKFDPAGNLIYAKPFDQLKAFYSYFTQKQFVITSDDANNIYLAGKFNGTVDFDPGPGVQNMTSPTYYSFFFAKYDPAGNYVYAKQLDGTNVFGNSYDFISDFIVDNNHKVYICGDFGSTFDFDPGAGVFSLSNQNNSFETNIFIANYDSSGNFIFAKAWGEVNGLSGYHQHNVFDMELDAQKRIYIAGAMDGNTADFGTVLHTWGYLGGWTGRDGYVAIYDSTGNPLFANCLQGIGLYDFQRSVSLDKNGKMILGGITCSNVDFDITSGGIQMMDGPPYSNIIMAKYTALDPEFRLRQATQEIEYLDTYNFGVVTVGSSSGKTFTVTNGGVMRLNLTSTPKVIVSGANASEFTINQAGLGQSLLEGTSSTFTINFTPAAAGLRTATVTIANNDPDEMGFTFYLNGGTAPDAEVQNAATAIADGGTFNFGNVNQLSTANENFTIFNTGAGTLQITGSPMFTITGADAADFSVDTTSTQRDINAGDSTHFTIAFTPTSPGTKTAQISFTSNDPDESPYNFTLNGICADNHAPEIIQVTSYMPDGYFNEPDTILIAVVFDEAVNVTGIPQLQLNSGGTANYLMGTGDATIYFRYVVGAGENSTDLDYNTTASLILAGGTLSDDALNVAVITLPSPGSFYSLGGLKNMIVDTFNPFAGFGASAGIFNPGVSFTLTITFNEPIFFFTPFDITVTNGTFTSFTADPNGYVYTIIVTPLSAGLLTIDIPAFSAFDLAGNPNATGTESFNVVMGMDEPEVSNVLFNIFPNPAGDELNIASPGVNHLFITDISGKTVYEKTEGFSDINTIDISTLTSGMYFVGVVNSGGMAVKKIIKK